MHVALCVRSPHGIAGIDTSDEQNSKKTFRESTCNEDRDENNSTEMATKDNFKGNGQQGPCKVFEITKLRFLL